LAAAPKIYKQELTIFSLMAKAKKKKSYRRRGYGKGAMMKPAIDGLIAGIAPGIIQKFAGNILGNLTGAASLGVVGYFRKNPTLIMLAGMEAGRAFGGGLVGATGGNGNGFYEG
jgi:hypothetical protein